MHFPPIVPHQLGSLISSTGFRVDEKWQASTIPIRFPCQEGTLQRNRTLQKCVLGKTEGGTFSDTGFSGERRERRTREGLPIERYPFSQHVSDIALSRFFFKKGHMPSTSSLPLFFASCSHSPRPGGLLTDVHNSKEIVFRWGRIFVIKLTTSFSHSPNFQPWSQAIEGVCWISSQVEKIIRLQLSIKSIGIYMDLSPDRPEASLRAALLRLLRLTCGFMQAEGTRGAARRR